MITERNFRGHRSATVQTVVTHTKFSPEMPCYAATIKIHGTRKMKNRTFAEKVPTAKTPGSNGDDGPVIIVLQ